MIAVSVLSTFSSEKKLSKIQGPGLLLRKPGRQPHNSLNYRLYHALWCSVWPSLINVYGYASNFTHFRTALCRETAGAVKDCTPFDRLHDLNRMRAANPLRR